MDEGLPVTLIVKAPNQQVADQTVQCEPSWTIRRLKGHLSEVYPCKPKSEEQKLIYSGRLLPDTVVLKDVLRKYEGQDTHTVHLVCTPPQAKYGNMTMKKSMPSSRDTLDSNTSNQNSIPSNSDPINNDGLRHRNVEDSSPSNRPQNENGSQNHNQSGNYFGFNPQYMNQEQVAAWNAQFNQWAASGYNMYPTTTNYAPFPNMPMPPPHMDPMMIAAQIAWMQHLRMQQYYNMTGLSPPQPFGLNHQTTGVNLNQPLNNTETQENREAPQLRREEPRNGNNDVADGEYRDWVECFYNISRWIVLISIVYFYSSPIRFFTVVILGATMYLVRLFRFQARLNNEAQNEQRRDDADNINNNYQQPNANTNENQNNTDEENENAEYQDTTQGINNEGVNEESALSIMWSAFTSFFSSLLPEPPNARN